MKYAGLFQRFFAFFIDCVVLVGLYMLIGLVLGVSIIFSPLLSLPMFGLWWYGSLFAFSWLYFSLFESSKWQGTIGKQLLKLKVVDEKGKRISFGRATGRHFAKILSRCTLMIGFLIIPFTKKKQALHDKIASTLVRS